MINKTPIRWSVQYPLNIIRRRISAQTINSSMYVVFLKLIFEQRPDGWLVFLLLYINMMFFFKKKISSRILTISPRNTALSGACYSYYIYIVYNIYYTYIERSRAKGRVLANGKFSCKWPRGSRRVSNSLYISNLNFISYSLYTHHIHNIMYTTATVHVIIRI